MLHDAIQAAILQDWPNVFSPFVTKDVRLETLAVTNVFAISAGLMLIVVLGFRVNNICFK